jgi:thiamine kinase-like enzyme
VRIILKEYIDPIQNHYGFLIRDYKPAPRGFCAETFFIETNTGKYFTKIYTNEKFTRDLLPSLKIQNIIGEKLDYIPLPIKTLQNNLFLKLENNIVISIYTCIDGKQYHTDNLHELIALMGNIYKSTIKSNKTEEYIISEKDNMEKILKEEISISKKLKEFIKTKKDFLIKKWNCYQMISGDIKEKSSCYYLTHGDMPGNLMIDKKGKVYIVDWDVTYMAPIERDFWFFMDNQMKINEIRDIFESIDIKWKFNQNYYDYYLYSRFFEDLFGYIELDILGNEKVEIIIKRIEQEVYNWLIPKMK